MKKKEIEIKLINIKEEGMIGVYIIKKGCLFSRGQPFYFFADLVITYAIQEL